MAKLFYTTYLPILIMAKFWNLPNSVTFFRLLMMIPFAYLLLIEEIFFAATIFILFIALDLVDGRLARMYNQTSSFGRNFDFSVDILIGVVIYVIALLDRRIPIGIFLVVFICYILYGLLVSKGWDKKKEVRSVAKRKAIGATINYTFVGLIALNIYNFWTELLMYILIVGMYIMLVLYWRQVKKSTSRS